MDFEEWVKIKDSDYKEDLDIWSASEGWYSAIDEVIKEWEKPYGLTDGRKFIDRLRDMSKK